MTERKPISKKLRFEIFKRDDFTCVYCGQKPPHVVLEVDHIVPVASGGENHFGNLITACFDCNRGKGKTELSSIPESLADKAARIKEAEAQLKAYRKILQSQADREHNDAWAVIHVLFGDSTHEIKKDWYLSIKRFHERLEHHDVLRAAEIASAKIRHDAKRFSYFCGICWNIIKTEGK